jgi:hypothetical protein
MVGSSGLDERTGVGDEGLQEIFKKKKSNYPYRVH